MNKNSAQIELGQAPIPALLFKLSLPSVLGLLILTTSQIIDTVFVGRFIGIYAVGGVAVVLPIVLLFSSIGRGLGVGGASIISRSMGRGDHRQANQVLGLTTLFWLSASLIISLAGLLFADPLLHLLGGNGQIFTFSRDYFLLLLPGLPLLSFAMLSNALIRAEGRASQAMLILVFPALINLLLDPIFIIYCDWGIQGAAAATSVAYLCTAGYSLFYFITGNNTLHLDFNNFIFCRILAKKILSLAMTPIGCQCLTALVAVVMNQTLFAFGGEVAMASYSIVQRFYMFILFPLVGICQGVSPICGYNYGNGNSARLQELIKHSIKAILLLATLISLSTLLLNRQIAALFTLDSELIRQSSFAIKTVATLLPLVAVQLMCSVYFQTLGLAFRSLLLTLLRQGLLLIPLILILSHFYGVKGVWYAYPLANLITCALSIWLVFPQWQRIFQLRVS